MANGLKITFTKVFGIPVAPDGISGGSTSIASLPVITGDYQTTVNIQMKTYTFDLKGISETKAQEIQAICDSNAEKLATGQIDLQNPSGDGIFNYRTSKCLPIGYQDGGAVSVGTNNANLSSFQVTCLTDTVSASL